MDDVTTSEWELPVARPKLISSHRQSVHSQRRAARKMAPPPSCANPAVDFDALSSGVRHRHECHVLRKVCIFNGTLVPHLAAGREHATHAQNVARKLIVRSQFGSHQVFPFAHLHPMATPELTSAAAQLMRLASPTTGAALSPCVPLVWVPTWAFSFADSWISSLVPIDELQSAGLIDDRVLLRPDLWAWPRSKNPMYQQIGALSAEWTRSLREAAPVCPEDRAHRAISSAAADPRGGLRQCVPQCYERVLLCQFKSTFDAYAAPMSPWRAGQRVAASVIRRKPIDARGAMAMGPDASSSGNEPSKGGRSQPLLRVLFVNRTRTKFPRSVANLAQLLLRCAQAKPREWPSGWRVRCASHEFGVPGRLLSDIRAARQADVLVGTHGAGLINAFFMRRGAVLVEARPYRFEGPWPDRYFRALTALEQEIFYLQISAGSAALSLPRPADDVSVWDARDHAVHVPWRSLKDALHAAIHINASRSRYVHWLWTKGAAFVSEAPKKLERAGASTKG